MGSPATLVRWGLVFNDNQSDERVLANSAALTSATTAWNGNGTRTRVRMAALSQAHAVFTNRVFSGDMNASVIHDASISPARVLDHNATSGTWPVRAGATPQTVLGCPRGVRRPAVTTLTPNLPLADFYMSCSSIVRQ